jgi:protein involved in polysaccharide export with SLBB domain
VIRLLSGGYSFPGVANMRISIFIIAVSLLFSGTAAAQSLSDARNLAEQCSGPLGGLIPECQAAKSAIDLSTNWRTISQPAAAAPVVVTNEESRSAAPPNPTVVQEPASEFQRFVASSVGRVLPIFGASLFENVPTTFAPLDRVPVTAEYAIGPGDEILLRVWGQVSLDLRLSVDRAGMVYIPQVGNIAVSGIQFKQLPDYLKNQLGRVFRNFDLSVNMGQLRSIQIYVMGQARRPGTYTVSSLSTLINALFASGGPSAQGSMRRVQLKRGLKIISEIDLYDLFLQGDKTGDVRLLPEDIIYIPTVGSQIAIAGSMKNPAIYELKSEKTLGAVINLGGGLTAVADRQHAKLERIINGASTREVVELELNSDGLNTPVKDGDVLRVQAIGPRFDNVVTLRGNVANPGRFAWREGMRLRDIIPDKDSLITRDYWKKRNVLGYTAAEDAMAASPSSDSPRSSSGTSLTISAPDINWSYAVVERQNRKDLKSELITFHLGKLVLENDEKENMDLRSGDVVSIFSQADIRVPQFQQTRTIRLEGEFNAPGVYNVDPGETLGHIIQKAGGLTTQAYLFGSEFLRESTRRDQQQRLDQYVRELESEIEKTGVNQAGKIVSADEATKFSAEIQAQRQLVGRLRLVKATGRIVLSLDPANSDISKIASMSLEDGDRFVVPPKPATVNVIGSVYNPNAFIHNPELPIKDYLRQAGGYGRNADEGRVYIIRADGSVLPKQHTSRFSRLQLNPGDSVIVPEQILKTSFMVGLRNWSQIISQFGLGAAAINVLR